MTDKMKGGEKMINLVQANNAVTQNAARNNRTQQESGQGFENLMSNVSQNERNDSANNNPQNRTNRAENTNGTRSDNRQRSETENVNVSENVASVETSPVQEIAENEAVVDVAEVIEEVVLADEEINAMMAEIAAILGISLVDLQVILENLEMPAEDLLVAENRIALLLAAKGLDNQAQLLTYPEALPLVQEMTQTVANYTVDEQITQNTEVLSEVGAEAEIEVPVQEIASQQVAVDNIVPETPQTTEALQPTSQSNIQAEVVPQAAANIAADVPQLTETTATNTATTNATQSAITPQNIARQIVQGAQLITSEQSAEIRIQLRPAHLGDVSMRIATINGIVTAQFVAESQRVKELIEAGFMDLRDALEQAGINIADIEVNVQSGDNPHFFESDDASQISSNRINDIMTAAMAEEEVEVSQSEQQLEENIVDYKI